MTFDLERSAGSVPEAGSDAGEIGVSSEARAEYPAGNAGFVLTSCGSSAHGLLIVPRMEYTFEATLAVTAGNKMTPSHVESFASVGLALGPGETFSIDSIFVDELTGADAMVLSPIPKGSVAQAVVGWVESDSGNHRTMSDVDSRPMTTPISGEAFNAEIDDGTGSPMSEPVFSGLVLLAVVSFVFRSCR